MPCDGQAGARAVGVELGAVRKEPRPAPRAHTCVGLAEPAAAAHTAASGPPHCPWGPALHLQLLTSPTHQPGE